MLKTKHIQDLHNYMYVEILSYLAPKDFLNLASTSRFFHNLLSDGSIWKAYIAKSGPNAVISCANIQVQTTHFYQFVKFAMKIFYSKPDNLITLNPYNGPLPLTPVEASSTDYNQSIDKVVLENPNSFWSSTGSPSEDSEEYLTFIFSKYLVVPTSVLVTFFTAAGFYEEGTLEFHSKRLQVQFSFDGNYWEYGSDIVEVNGKHEIEIKMNGKVGIARYMKVNVIGKTMKQPTDNLYYNAIQSIKAKGYQINSSVTNNNSINELFIKSWITWQSEKLAHNPHEGQVDRGKEIVDYYASQTFSSDIYAKFLDVLASKDNDAIWAYLEANEFLLTLEKAFIDIFTVHKEFGLYYFKRIIEEKKRRGLDTNETLLMFLLFAEVDDSTVFRNIVEVLSGKYNIPILTSILYMTITTNTLRKLREILGVGTEFSINFLKTRKQIIFDEPTDYSVDHASIVLFHHRNISKQLGETLSSQVGEKRSS